MKANTSSNTDTQGCIDRLPMGTDLLGIDGEGYEHHFSQAKWSVSVRFEGEIIYEQEIAPGTLSEWVEHIDGDDKRGWKKLNYSSGRALAGDADHVAAAMGDGR